MRLWTWLFFSAGLSSGAAQAASVFDDPSDDDVSTVHSIDDRYRLEHYVAQRDMYIEAQRVYMMESVDSLQERIDILEDQVQYMGAIVDRQSEAISQYQAALAERDAADAARQADVEGAAAEAPAVATQLPQNPAAVRQPSATRPGTQMESDGIDSNDESSIPSAADTPADAE